MSDTGSAYSLGFKTGDSMFYVKFRVQNSNCSTVLVFWKADYLRRLLKLNCSYSLTLVCVSNVDLRRGENVFLERAKIHTICAVRLGVRLRVFPLPTSAYGPVFPKHVVCICWFPVRTKKNLLESKAFK